MVSKIKAVLDACVLHPFHLRNLFLQLAVDDVIDVFWSDEISREWLKSVSAKIPAALVERLRGQLAKMNEVLPEANVHVAGNDTWTTFAVSPTRMIVMLSRRRNKRRRNTSSPGICQIFRRPLLRRIT
jgi:hypothetical protein